MADQSVRETAEIGRQVDLDVMRLLGEARGLETAERRMDRESRIQAYRKAGLDQATATTTADRDLLQLAEARAEVMARIVRDAEAEHQLALARLSGDDSRARWLDTEDRIRRRARQIESDKGLNFGEGVDQAQSEIQQELDAEGLGARRAWLRGVKDDIRNGGIGEALREQLERGTDRWLDRLLDQLAEIDWAAFFKGGGKGIGGASDTAWNALLKSIGWNSAGTDFWPGGLTFVGERGPELLNLPRGSKVVEHNRSMQALRGAVGGAVQPVTHNHFNGNLMTPEFWAEINRRDQAAARAGASQGAASAVSYVRNTASEVQHGDRMLKG